MGQIGKEEGILDDPEGDSLAVAQVFPVKIRKDPVAVRQFAKKSAFEESFEGMAIGVAEVDEFNAQPL